ncbi:MAG: glycosyltransferase family 39 protein [Vicinamibacterales bacterium]
MTERRVTWGMGIAIAAVLCLAVDAALVGRIADGRQMIFTAVAITESGSLGQARSRDLTVPRPAGDSVSRYGLGMSLAQVPAAALAPAIEERRGPGSSQWLFLIAPFVMVLASGLLAARIARDLSGRASTGRAALLLATIASPFGVYAAMELSEPLQALALTATFAFALRAAVTPAPSRARSQAILAGVAVGVAVLTKSSLLAVAPLALLPLLCVPRDRVPPADGRPRRSGGPKGPPNIDVGRVFRAGPVLWGFLPIATVWLYFEIARFGHPFAGYAGEGFTHSFVDGAWRLLVGPNKGLLFYFPATVVAVAALVHACRCDRPRAIVLAGAILPAFALWLLAAPWWAWHGVDGWGPRLLVPGIPLLAAAAAVGMAEWRPLWRAALIALSILINVPPLLQHPTTVVRYTWACAWPEADAQTAAGLPHFARRQAGGRTVMPPDQVLASTSSASPFIVLPWFFQAAHADGADGAARLAAPPWLSARPDIRPPSGWSDGDVAFLIHPAFAVYAAALTDQVLRAQQLREGDRALELALKLERLAPDGFADALLLESYRLLRRKDAAIDWLTQLPLERRLHPAINVVLALWERADGREEQARALLRSSAPSYPGAPLQRAVDSALVAWPADFAAMTADPSLEVRYN